MNWYSRDLHDRCASLRQRSARLRADGTALQNTYMQIKEQMQHAPAATGVAIYDAPASDPHDRAMEVLRVIRALIDPFPLEWQVAIVKALTARTLIMAHERTRPTETAISA